MTRDNQDAQDEVQSIIDKMDAHLLDSNYKRRLAQAIIDHLEVEGYLIERYECQWGNPSGTVACENIAAVGKDYCYHHLN